MSKIAYTIGSQTSYDREIPLGENTKIGQRPHEDPPYPGGVVWQTTEEAKQFIETTNLPFKAKVYGLQLENGWDIDVSSEPDEKGLYHLVNDATLFILE